MNSPACAMGVVPVTLPPVSPLPDLDAGLRTLGFERFRPGQREAIEILLDKGRVLLVAPTGGGKSLTYQLPATLLPGTTLVISPLIALMEDQVAALRARGVSATYVASTLEPREVSERLSRARLGEYRLVYVAPERVATRAFHSLLSELDCPLLAIDEAHCISEWGHDFRPDYLGIGKLVQALPHARVLACTATATPVVRDEIVSRLGLGPSTEQIVRGFARDNLALRAFEVESAKERQRLVDGALDEALGAPDRCDGAAIVYAPTRNQAEREAARLAQSGWHAAAYHAGLDGSLRGQVQGAFTRRELSVVVATNAFGMGIDRADVRAVVHLAPPSSVEAYYQEVGRAGRDGKPAIGVLCTSRQDLPLRRRLIEGGGELPVLPEIVEHKWNLFLDLMRWAEGGTCRHDGILRYFGSHDETSTDGCGRCDVCTSLDEAPDDTDAQLVVQKALSGVARAHGRLGLAAVVKLLRGEPDPRLERLGLTAVRTFGSLADRPSEWVASLLRRCVTAGWINFTPSERPVVLLTEEGRGVMMGSIAPKILLPRTSPTRKASAGRQRRGTAQARSEDLESLDSEARTLFEALRQHRLEVARKEGVPPYVVASDRTLRDVARMKPCSFEDLLRVHGVGKAKAERFGEGLLSVVRNGVPGSLGPGPPPKA